ncbi:MAG: pyruvate kinase alpha/beta domain-containing protein [Candidatus Acetothermia bacterium]
MKETNPNSSETIYWEEPGRKNTRKTLEVVSETLRTSKIQDVVIASNSGKTVEEFLEVLDGSSPNTVCVTHHVGFREPGVDEMAEEKREELKSRDVDLLTTTHALAGVARSIKNDYGGLYPAEIMAETLRMFGQGVKVCVEISVMALDAGLVPYGEELIGVGGTGRGADTACKIRPGHSNDVFSTEVREILCRPKTP